MKKSIRLRKDTQERPVLAEEKHPPKETKKEEKNQKKSAFGTEGRKMFHIEPKFSCVKYCKEGN